MTSGDAWLWPWFVLVTDAARVHSGGLPLHQIWGWERAAPYLQQHLHLHRPVLVWGRETATKVGLVDAAREQPHVQQSQALAVLPLGPPGSFESTLGLEDLLAMLLPGCVLCSSYNVT